jgi:UDP-N-acetylglucosamine--N-acetylmuramyl-(pentapeptide) pyrophosphoryl-undecaprenol N-acetylglucosamine transferase
MMKRRVEHLATETNVQVIWQTGKYYEAEIDRFMATKFGTTDVSASPSLRGAAGDAAISNIWRGAFIDRMDLAYAAADLVISRSGAGTVSELCLLGKAVMFVPSPNVSEDHQTKNAMALVEKNAAEICPDSKAVEQAIPTALRLLGDRDHLATLSSNIKSLAIPDSADRVAKIVIELS